MDFEIYWDGACSADKILEYAPKGVRGFVLGTTLLFGKEQPYGETIQNIRQFFCNCEVCLPVQRPVSVFDRCSAGSLWCI